MPPLVEAHQVRTSLVIPRRECSFICFMSFAGRLFSWIPYLFSGENQTLNFSAIVTELYIPIPMLFLKCPQKHWLEEAHLIFVTAFPCSVGKRYMHGTSALRASLSNGWKRRKKDQKNLSAVSVARRVFSCVLVNPYSHKPFSLLGGMC